MLYGICEGIDVNKKSASKECINLKIIPSENVKTTIQYEK